MSSFVLEEKDLVKIGVLELIGYREWTEELGSDREWIIQTIQSGIYKFLQEELSKANGFVLPLRYDYYILVLNGVDADSIAKIMIKLADISPVPLRLAVSCGESPYEAQSRATSMLRKCNDTICVSSCDDEHESQKIAVAHFDINSFTKKIESASVYDTFIEIEELCIDLSLKMKSIGGITQYLGGDNIVTFLSPSKINDLKEMILRDDLKVGVGIAYTTRKAMELATRALDLIRSMRRNGVHNKIIILEE